jgi:hypothetical protein
MATYFAADLGPSFAIIVVEVLSWSIAMLASVLVGNTEALTGLNRSERPTVSSLIVFEESLPVDRRGLGSFWRLLAKWG